MLARRLTSAALSLGLGLLFALAHADEPADRSAEKTDGKGAPSVAAPSASPSASAPAAGPSTSASVTVEPPPVVTVGKPRMVKGGALPKGTEAALAEVQGALEACYRDAIAKGREGAPSIEVRLELVGPGQVAAATVNASVDASDKLRGCVRDAYEGLGAAGAIGPAPVEVLVSIAFDRTVADDLVLAPSSCPRECAGELSDELKNELRGRALRTAHCFKRPAAGGESPTLKAGSLQVSVRIAGDGTVCGVATGGDAFGRPSLTTCVADTMSEPFANAPTGCVDVSVPLVFKGS